MEDKCRSLYTHEEYISLVLHSGSGLAHDYVSQSIREDPRMMAFFDSLVRREIEGWSSDSDSDLSEEAIMQLHARGRRSPRAAAAAAPAAAADPRTDSGNSSSSSLAGPDASGGEEQAGEEGEERPRRRSRHPSGLLEDSDSSEFWLDPMPRPRSPSPRDNSVLSSPASSPSLPAGASSPSTSTSSSSSDDEERRSAVRRRNVMRRRRMNVVSRAGDRPESVQALFSALDSCSYPSISVEDPSSSSADEDKRSAQATPHSRPAKDEDSCLSPSDFVCHSPEMSQEGGGCGAEAGEPGGSARPHRTGSDSKEACGASLSPEVNGQHRPASPTGGGVSSDAEEEEGLSPGDGRPQSEKGAAKKRTHLGAHPSGSSPTEKKLRT